MGYASKAPSPLPSPKTTLSIPYRPNVAHPIVKDLIICIFSPTASSNGEPNPQIWHRIEKELYLHTSQQTAWVYVALADEEKLTAEDLVVVDIKVGGLPEPPNPRPGHSWERRLGGIWLLRSRFSGKIEIDKVVTAVDVLFGMDAVDPRPGWALIRSPLQLSPPQRNAPIARLSVLHGRTEPRPGSQAPLRVREDGKFKILQISDTHMVTGVGVCTDALDADGKLLPESVADPLTVEFIGKIMDIEKPDLVVLTGDQLHHDIADSPSALLKLLAPIIKRSTPWASVFGNHDDQGIHALSRMAQMSILEGLPFSLCESGPEQIDGVGNFYRQILAPAPSQVPLSTLYFLDSHGEIQSERQNPDYDPIKPSQIDWLTNTSEELRRARDKDGGDMKRFHTSMVFQHIPISEFAHPNLEVRSGNRREPTECPSLNSHLYDALKRAGVSVISVGHDHVNDFGALLPQHTHQDDDSPPPPPQVGPWLCYAGGSGFGGYGSYDGKRYHRRMRVFEIDTRDESLKTWKRVEYNTNRVDELVLVSSGAVVGSLG